MTLNNETLLVKINHHGLIPLVGPGPIIDPIRVTPQAKATIEALIGKEKVVVVGEEKKEVKVAPVVKPEPVKTPQPVKTPEPVKAPKAEEKAPVAKEEEVVEETTKEEPKENSFKKKNK